VDTLFLEDLRKAARSGARASSASLEFKVTHDKKRKLAVRKEAKARGLPYQTVLEERWRPDDADHLRVRLLAVIADICRGRLPRSNSADDSRVEGFVADLVRVAIEPTFRYFGPARERVIGDEIGPERVEACMRLVSDFVLNRDVQPLEWEQLTNDLTFAVAAIVCRRCPGHRTATKFAEIKKRTSSWLHDDGGDFEKLTDED
jgi:hypothetical protein